MPPELVTAIVGAFISAVVAMGASAALLPRFLDARMEIYKKTEELKLQTEKTEHESRLQAEKAAREEAMAMTRQQQAAAIEKDAQFGRLIDSLITERAAMTAQLQALVGQNEVVVRALTASIPALDAMSKELRANTTVSIENAAKTGIVNEQLDLLLKEGSQPVKELNRKVDKLLVGVSTNIENGRNHVEQISQLNEKMDIITQWINSLKIAKLVVKASIEDATRATGEMPTANPSPA